RRRIAFQRAAHRRGSLRGKRRPRSAALDRPLARGRRSDRGSTSSPEPDDADDDQIDRDDVVEQPGNDEDQYSGDERDERPDGESEVHGETCLGGAGRAGATSTIRTSAARVP